jgi:tripartite-type tricarboxylate transporter receptor subunit TctC
MATEFKQPVVVENKSGARGAIGAQAAARSAPDGYTLLIANSSLYVINPLLEKSSSYNPIGDLRLLSLIADIPLVLVIRPTLRADSIGELASLAKKEQGRLNFGSAGNGTTLHMAAEMFKEVAGIDMVHVPFTGSSPAMSMLLGGQIDLMFADVPNALPHIQAGTLRALAVSSRTRLAVLPQVPTMSEAGFREFDAHVWFGVAAPARTPDAIAARAKAVADQALDDRPFSASLSGLGFNLHQRAPAHQIEAQVALERRRWGRVISNQKIALD